MRICSLLFSLGLAVVAGAAPVQQGDNMVSPERHCRHGETLPLLQNLQQPLETLDDINRLMEIMQHDCVPRVTVTLGADLYAEYERTAYIDPVTGKSVLNMPTSVKILRNAFCHDYWAAAVQETEPRQITLQLAYVDHARLLQAACHSELEPELSDREKKALELARSWVESLVDEDMSDLDKLLVLHDKLIEWVDYDKPMRRQYSSAVNVLNDKLAICSGYSRVMQLLLGLVDIPCHYVIGRARYNNELHAWNLVRIADKWYYVDATWNDPCARPEGVDIPEHGFLLLTEKEMDETHELFLFDSLPVSALPDDSYYTRSGHMYASFPDFWKAAENRFVAGATRFEAKMLMPAFETQMPAQLKQYRDNGGKAKVAFYQIHEKEKTITVWFHQPRHLEKNEDAAEDSAQKRERQQAKEWDVSWAPREVQDWVNPDSQDAHEYDNKLELMQVQDEWMPDELKKEIQEQRALFKPTEELVAGVVQPVVKELIPEETRAAVVQTSQDAQQQVRQQQRDAQKKTKPARKKAKKAAGKKSAAKEESEDSAVATELQRPKNKGGRKRKNVTDKQMTPELLPEADVPEFREDAEQGDRETDAEANARRNAAAEGQPAADPATDWIPDDVKQMMQDSGW